MHQQLHCATTAVISGNKAPHQQLRGFAARQATAKVERHQCRCLSTWASPKRQLQMKNAFVAHRHRSTPLPFVASSIIGRRGSHQALGDWQNQQPFRMSSRASGLTVKAHSATPAGKSSSSPPKSQMLIHVPPHPLIKHWLAVARNEASPSPVFRAAVAELGRLLIYECMRDWMPVVEGQVPTPMGVPADAEIVDPERPIKVIPILRAGSVMLEQATTVLPHCQTFHLGMSRDEALQASIYLNKLPDTFSADDKILLCDAVLATGGTMLAAMEELVSRGSSPNNIRIISVVSGHPALKALSTKYPGCTVYTGMIDSEVDDKGFVIPGLGDAADRAFTAM